jgi:CAAX prenyl protease-like protein
MDRKYPWLVFLLPFLVFAVVGSLEPTPDKPGGTAMGLAITYSQYPLIYALKIGLTIAAMIFVLPGYREFSFRISPLAVGVGVVGVVIWIGLCRLDLEHRYLQPLLEKIGLGGFIGSGTRAGFNPLEQLKDQPLWAWTFLAIRFLGLAMVVPIIEEFFLRGFVMRFVMEREWWKTPFGTVNRMAIVVGTLVPLCTHPGELLAAAVWFSMVTWLMLRTKNIWDCIAAHAVTNLLLGIYVVTIGGEAWRMM